MKNFDPVCISDYDYALPDERIAKFPLKKRDDSKLLVYRHGDITTSVFSDVWRYLPEGCLLAFNNTRVIQARIYFRKSTGALIEVFLLEPALPADYEQAFQSVGRCGWHCIAGNLKKWKGEVLRRQFSYHGRQFTLSAELKETHGTSHLVEFTWDNPDMNWAQVLDVAGELPIPPYLHRKAVEADKTTYQTVYSKIKGSVAAPTAGLHFTPEVLRAIDGCGIDREEITLHVGAGTFKPVKCEEIHSHEMHTEYIAVSRGTIDKLLKHGGKAAAVGTTTVRTLESLYYIGLKLHRNPRLQEEELCVSQWEPYETGDSIPTEEALGNIARFLDDNSLQVLHSSTQIMIVPGFEYKIVNLLITNFHQPKSTLLLLVSAFLNGDWRKVYDYALTRGFRFLSYGDSCVLIP